jgi:hypothetical protein
MFCSTFLGGGVGVAYFLEFFGWERYDWVMLFVPLLNSSISILVWHSSCVSDLARLDSTFHRYGNSDTDFL